MNPSRATLRQRWVAATLGHGNFDLARASEDASFRSYWRVSETGHAPRILMDAPPGNEDIGPWLDVARRLHAAGLHAPQVFADERESGFVLMEDLGARTYLGELGPESVEPLYADALDALIHMQMQVGVDGLPHYDETRLVGELELMPTWFLGRHLGQQPSCDEWDIIEAAFRVLVDAALEQPRAFVHRDYHSRNLLVTPANSPGIIDFQDAVIGPVTYDLVSLLRDCYIEWPPEHIAGWVETYRQRLRHAQLIGPGIDSMRFTRWFDLMGLQRHIKVLGIFCRLHYRDGKAQYLGDLPLVWRYVTSVAQRYPELVDFVQLLKRCVGASELDAPRPMATCDATP